MAIDKAEVERLVNQQKYAELKRELQQLDQDELDNLNAQLVGYRELESVTEALLATRQRTFESLEKEYDKLTTIMQVETDRIAKQEVGNQLRDVAVQMKEEELRVLREVMAGQDSLTVAQKDKLKDLKKELAQRIRIRDAHQRVQSIVGKTNPLLEKARNKMDDFKAAAEEGAGAMASIAMDSAQAGLKGAISAGQGLFDKVVSVVKDLIFGLDEATKAFERQFQVGEEYTESIESQYKALNEYGVSIEDVTKTQGALIQGFTDFTMLSKEQRDVLTESANVMQELGIQQEDFATIVQNSTKAFGMSIYEAEESVRELAATARELGRAPGEMAAEFAKAGPRLAKFGSDATQTFKELARVAKLTGMEIDKLLNMTDKFDTFEGAATQAGQLNAALGGNFVNAMEMMTATDPVERFEMLRGSLLDAGLTFDDMSYYQRKFFAESMGIDSVNDLALMMSGNMDSLAGSTQKSAEELEAEAERARELQTFMEQLQIILVENSEEFMKLAGFVEKGVKFLAEFGHLIPKLVKLMVLLKVTTFLLSIAQMGLAIANMTSAKGAKKAGIAMFPLAVALVLSPQLLLFGSPSMVVIAMFALALGLFAVGRAGETASPGLTIVAGLLPVIAASIFLVAMGASMMALAFAELNTAQLIAINVALLGFAAALYFLVPALISAGASATVASPGLAILSGVILAIGASVFMAAAGVALMALGMSEMFKHMDVEKMMTFTVFTGILVLGAPYFMIAGYGLLTMAAGAVALAMGLALIKTADLEAIAKFAEGIANIELGAMRELVSLIREVGEAMSEMPTESAITLTGTMNAAAEAARAAEILVRGGGLSNNNNSTNNIRSSGGNLGTINLTFNNEMFEDKVIDLVDDEFGHLMAEGARGE